MDKIEENYCRRWAKRLGLTLEKSRAKRWNIDNQGGYRLIETHRNLVLYGYRFELTPEDVNIILSKYEAEQKT
jgi:hypothetical protein